MDITNILVSILIISMGISLIIYKNILIGRGRVNLDGSIVFLYGELVWDIIYLIQISVIDLRYKVIFYNLSIVASAVSVVGFFIFMQTLTKGSMRSLKMGYSFLSWPVLIFVFLMYFELQRNYEIFILNPTLREFYQHNFLVFSGYTRLAYIIFVVNFFIAILTVLTTLFRVPNLRKSQKRNILMLLVIFFGIRFTSFMMALNFIGFDILNSMVFGILSMVPLKLFIYAYISNADLFNMMMVNRYSLVEKIQDSVLVLDQKGMILDYNKASVVLLGKINFKKVDEIQNFFSELKQSIPEFDLEKNKNQIIEYAFDLPNHQRKVFEIEMMDIALRKDIFSNKDNKFKKDYMLFIKDITQSYKKELDFMKYKAAFYSTEAGILMVNKEGYIEDVNPGFVKLTGYSEEEVIGKKPNILQSGYHDKEYYKAIWDIISGGKTWSGRFYNKKKDGTKYWEKCTISPITTKDGRITHYMGIKEDVTLEKEAEDDLKEQSYVDYLTGIFNRRNLMEKSMMEFINAREKQQSISVLMMDIDHFKAINDNFGHAYGDDVLKVFADISQNAIRKSDILGRYGGEEFMLTLPCSSQESAIMIAEKIRQNMKNYIFKNEGERIQITVSIGVAVINEEDRTLTELIERADKALYEAKETGRDRVVAR